MTGSLRGGEGVKALCSELAVVLLVGHTELWDGYDYTFSAPKSVSGLRAVAAPGTLRNLASICGLYRVLGENVSWQR